MTPELKQAIINVAKADKIFVLEMGGIGLKVLLGQYDNNDYYLDVRLGSDESIQERFKTHVEVIKKLEEVL